MCVLLLYLFNCACL